MPYFKLSYKDGSEKVVHAQKGSYPYRDGNEIASGVNQDTDGTWDISNNYRFNGYGNEWIYIWLSYNLCEQFKFRNNVYKFNNNLYQLSFYGLSEIHVCSKDYYHEHKNIVGEAEKTSYGIRDSQRQRVYDAERFIKHECKMTKEETIEFVKDVFRSDVWKELNNKFARLQDVTIALDLEPRGKKFATGGMMKVVLPEWARTKGVVLHELAHVIVQRTYKYSERLTQNIQAHGKEYCYFYLVLMENFYPDGSWKLMNNFDDWKVKYLTEMPEYIFQLNHIDYEQEKIAW